jgi:hypothetical protein
MPALVVVCALPAETEVAPPDWVGAGTGKNELTPTLPSSVAPGGMPTRPAEGETGEEDGILASAHESDVFPARPPPSKSAPEGPEFPDLVHVSTPRLCEGMMGSIPGVAISVEPSGIPDGWPELDLVGDVALTPIDGCMFGETEAWASAGSGQHKPMPVTSETDTSETHSIVRPLRVGWNALSTFEQSCLRMNCAPSGSCSHQK